MRRLLTAFASLLVLLAFAQPAAGNHTLPDDCAFNPVPTTYEAMSDRAPYLIGAELAAYNMIKPNDSYFGTATVEAGRRGNRSIMDDPYIPPRLLKAIGYVESNTAQADHSVYWGSTGPVKVSFDCGHGIMQVTSGMVNPTENGRPSKEQSLVTTHYLFNIARGAAILVDKWNAAPEVRPVVGNGDPRVVESWYYAVWGYNGFASVNNPLYPGFPSYPRTPFSCGPSNDGLGHNRGNYPYQELVYGCIAHPPRVGSARLWPALNVSLPNLNNANVRNAIANFPNASQMDIPTPSPSHVDNTAKPPAIVRGVLLGSPALRVNRTSISGTVNNVTISNPGGGILAWRVRPQQSWTFVNKQAGVALGAGVPCTPGYRCDRSTTLTISVNTATAPSAGQGQVIVENLITGGSTSITVQRGTWPYQIGVPGTLRR
ncbi:MAG: hypothetical protein WBD55_01805 [Dehalococcoidia bacterium]